MSASPYDALPDNFPYDTGDKSLLECEQDFLDAGGSEDDLNRLYPGIDDGRGHRPECCCSQCDPYYDYDVDGTLIGPSSLPDNKYETRPYMSTFLKEEPRYDDHPF